MKSYVTEIASGSPTLKLRRSPRNDRKPGFTSRNERRRGREISIKGIRLARKNLIFNGGAENGG